jgi:hypothetical protein
VKNKKENSIKEVDKKKRKKAIPVTGRGGL